MGTGSGALCGVGSSGTKKPAGEDGENGGLYVGQFYSGSYT